jgi:excisionase family DNA binding protein
VDELRPWEFPYATYFRGVTGRTRGRRVRLALRPRQRSRTMSAMSDVITPTPEAVRAAEGALRSLSNHEPAGIVLRVRENGGSADVDLPREVVPLLVEILGQIANGNGVRVVPLHADLTLPQAADLLNVSERYLVGLLESETLPSHHVGTHRRVKLGDVLDYKRVRDAERADALREMAEEAQRLGLGT